MNLSVSAQRKLRTATYLLLTGMVAGPVFAAFAHGFEEIFPFVNAFLIGTFIAGVSAFFELQVFDGRLCRLKFLHALALRSAFYFMVILLVSQAELISARMIRYELSFRQVLDSAEYAHYMNTEYPYVLLYAVVLVACVNFTRQMVRKVGRDVMLNLITGRYYHPVYEERVFLFLALKSPRQMAHKLGHQRFHRFLNDLAGDIATPLLAHGGEIYQYVEDLMVVTWKYRDGMEGARCFRAWQDIRSALGEAEEDYLRKYGVAPELHAAFHGGRVVRGEIGDLKTEMVFHGDVMNTSARILELSLEHHKEVLISGDLIADLPAGVPFRPELCGSILLRGKTQPIELYCLQTQSALRMSA
jgi:adenylate cyclase